MERPKPAEREGRVRNGKLNLSAIRPDWKEILRNYLLLTLGAGVLVVGANLFLTPHRIAPGGTLGLALIVQHFLGFSPGLTMLVLNSPMLVLGFFYLGRYRFLLRTLYAVLLYNLGLDLFQPLFPPEGLTADPLLNTLYGGIVGGIGTGLVLRGRGTIAGTGVLSRLLQFQTGMPTSQVYMLIDGSVIALQGLAFGWEASLYALIALFLWGLATDYVLEGPSVVRTAFIVTDAPKDVAFTLGHRLGVGATSWAGRGMFTDAERTVLFCTVSRPEVETLKSIVSEIDPKAFIVIGQGHQTKGGVLRPGKRPKLPPDQNAPPP